MKNHSTYMGDQMKRITKLVAAGLLSTALVAPGGMIVAQARTITGEVADLTIESIDAGQKAGLKILTPDAATAPLAGVTYIVERIDGIDLTTKEGWDRAVALTENQARTASKSHTFTAVTDGNGLATFEELPVGVYFITEELPSDAPRNHRKSKPMILTLPVGDPDTGAWQYEVKLTAKGQPGSEPTGSSGTGTLIVPIPVPVPVPPGKTSENPPPPDTPVEPPVIKKGPPKKGIPGLPDTGASVFGVIGIGLVLMVLGIFLLRYRRKDKK
ncbi:pilin N-terminal domain-containing protein [Corynebacterium sp. CCM 9204]|uniref:pilin N-terminal domain-containing protein n=1 Tax=Corynebacterium sp. CCM 9204 TaxID=3057616 RepID=UPI00352575A4